MHLNIDRLRNKRSFPWYFFKLAAKFTIDGVDYRLSFIQPQNTEEGFELDAAVKGVSNLSASFSTGAVWKNILKMEE